MHLILYRRSRKNTFINFLLLFDKNKNFFPFFFSGILHFVKDNYLRLSSSSSDDEYDSDDQIRKNDNTTTSTSNNNTQNKVQPLVGSLVNTAALATAVVTMSSATMPNTGYDNKRYKKNI